MQHLADTTDLKALYALSGWSNTASTDALLAALPAVVLEKRGNESYIARWTDHTKGVTITANSRTNPANALCRLAIRLFEQGVLPRAR